MALLLRLSQPALYYVVVLSSTAFVENCEEPRLFSEDSGTGAAAVPLYGGGVRCDAGAWEWFRAVVSAASHTTLKKPRVGTLES